MRFDEAVSLARQGELVTRPAYDPYFLDHPGRKDALRALRGRNELCRYEALCVYGRGCPRRRLETFHPQPSRRMGRLRRPRQVGGRLSCRRLRVSGMKPRASAPLAVTFVHAFHRLLSGGLHEPFRPATLTRRRILPGTSQSFSVSNTPEDLKIWTLCAPPSHHMTCLRERDRGRGLRVFAAFTKSLLPVSFPRPQPVDRARLEDV